MTPALVESPVTVALNVSLAPASIDTDEGDTVTDMDDEERL